MLRSYTLIDIDYSILPAGLNCRCVAFKAGLPPSEKVVFICFDKLFKTDEKCVLFHVTSPFRS